MEVFVSNKIDRIIAHLKKCIHCTEQTTPEEREKVFNLSNDEQSTSGLWTLSRPTLEVAVSEYDREMFEALQKDSIGVTLMFDGWTNVNNKQLMGIMLVTLVGKPYIWKVMNISIERERYTKVIEKTEEMIDELKKINVKIIAIVTDSVGPYAATRLRPIHRNIVFLFCYVHQLNLCIGEVFKESTDLKSTIDKVIQLG
ncbi:401_t:CDS:2, partial [Cetraspora pellucida]